LIPGYVLATYIAGGDQKTIGISNMIPIFYSGQTLTFTVTPLDAKKTPMISSPVSTTLIHDKESTDCTGQGIQGNMLNPNLWNNNKNVVYVSANSTAGAAGGLAVNSPSGVEIYFSGYNGINYRHTIGVPENYSAVVWCDKTGNLSCSRNDIIPWKTLLSRSTNGILDLTGTCLANCYRGF
jgi:hypothetical protein